VGCSHRNLSDHLFHHFRIQFLDGITGTSASVLVERVRRTFVVCDPKKWPGFACKDNVSTYKFERQFADKSKYKVYSHIG
jgi:hypothetical protein